MTLEDTYQLPHMDECIYSIGKASVFSTFDLNCGYCQITIARRTTKRPAARRATVRTYIRGFHSGFGTLLPLFNALLPSS